MSIDLDQSREHAVALSIELWSALSSWWDNLPGERVEGKKTAVTPNVSAGSLLQAAGPLIYQYLNADAESSLNTRVRVLRATIEMFGHDDWAANARKTAQAHGGDGKSFDAFRVLSKNTKQVEKKQLFLDLVKSSTEAAVKQSTATLSSVSRWSVEPETSKKHKM